MKVLISASNSDNWFSICKSMSRESLNTSILNKDNCPSYKFKSKFIRPFSDFFKLSPKNLSWNEKFSNSIVPLIFDEFSILFKL